MRKYSFLLLTSLFLSGCSVFKPEKSSKNIVVNMVQINDVYEIDAINNGKTGGLARVGHISDNIKKQNPNTWFVLAGDFVNPSLLGTIKVDGERLQGKQIIEVLNAAGLDLVTFGNHEFDIKESDLQKRMNESDFAWTSANTFQIQEDGTYKPFYKTKGNTRIPVSDYEILKAGNSKGDSINIGVFGVTIPSNPKDFVHYGDMYQDAVRAYNLVAPQTDFVVGLTHVALDEDKEIARLLPNIPLIMGGHEHYNMKHKVGNTVITKADANVASLYLHTFIYNPRNKKLKLKSELIKVTDKYPSKPEVQTLVDKWNKILNENLKLVIDNPDEIIFNAVDPLDGTDEASRSEQTNLGGIICKAMTYVYKDRAEASITNGGGIRIDDRLQGNITSKDIFRILPYGGKIMLVEMEGDLLKEVLNYGVRAGGTGAYLQRDGLEENILGDWLINNEKIEDNKVYKIALNDFLLLGLDIPFLTDKSPGIVSVHEPNESELAGDLRKSIIHYLKK